MIASVNRHRAIRHAVGGMLCSLGIVSGCVPDVARDEPALWKHDPDRTYRVLITGRDFNWYIRYPGPDNELGTADDIHARRDLHLPQHTKVRLELASDDYLYSLTLPQWNLKEIAVPDLSFCLEFDTQVAGTFDLLGDQMCGYTHPNLLGQLTVQSHSDFDAWLKQRRRAARAHDGGVAGARQVDR
jgi:cytochrome c oxidase subunit 2